MKRLGIYLAALCLGYFVCLVGFAAIYSFRHNDFMYTSDMAHVVLNRYRDETLAAFDDSLVDRSRTWHGPDDAQRWVMHVDSVRFCDIRFADDGGVHLKLLVPIESGSARQRLVETLRIDAHIRELTDIYWRPDLFGRVPVIARGAELEGTSGFTNLGTVLLDSVLVAPPKNQMPYRLAHLPPSLEMRLQKLERGERGYPIARPEGWTAFLYFSAVAITTLGFGDVIPSTGLGQAIVITETMLGLALLTGIAACLGAIASKGLPK
jgi:hypothetical protein